tara:strand:- start:164 stop:550 length:387 start_codon:yes stop_codon:yes gene_type:complete
MSLESVSSAHEITVDEFVSGKVTPLSIEDRVYEWTEKLVECLQANYDVQSSTLSTKFEIRRGRKFLKIVMINNQESVHAFIDKKTGEVYKPASWNKAAQHVRYDLRIIRSRMDCYARADWAGGYLYMR